MAKRWTEEEKQFVIENYRKIPIDNIVKHINRSKQCIYTFISENNLSTPNPWTEKEDRIILENRHLTAKQTSKLLDRTHIAIKHRRQELGLEFEWRGYTKYNVNHNFFSTPNLLNCYIAGFIAGDGNVGKKQAVLRIILSKRDKDHLIKLKESLDYTGPIRTHIGGSYKPESLAVILQVSSKQILDDLNKNFNIIPNKTFTLQPPPLNNNQFKKAYISGLIDADGSIFISNKRLNLSLTGNQSILKWVKEFFDINYPSVRNPTNLCKSRNSLQYTISGSRAVMVIKDFIKLDVPLLERKWNKIYEYEEELNNE